MATAARVFGDQAGSAAPLFLAFLAVHVLAGITAVIAGAAAALARKGSPRHIRAGRWYYRAITVVFTTATLLAAVRWRQDYYLFILGAEDRLAAVDHDAVSDLGLDRAVRRHGVQVGVQKDGRATGIGGKLAQSGPGHDGRAAGLSLLQAV